MDGGVFLARFTAKQKKISEAMKLLINLYYRFLEIDREDLFSPPIIEDVAALIDLTIPNFRPCLFFQDHSYFRYGEEDFSIGYRNEHIEALVEILKLLQNNIRRGILRLFEIKGRTVESRQEFEHDVIDHSDVLPPFKEKGSTSFPICRIIPSISEDADDDTITEYYNLKSSTLNKAPNQFESFRIKVHYSDDDPDSNEDPGIFSLERGSRISSLGYFKPKAGFIHVIKYLLVKYQYLFGSFERVKICNQCHKLFVEKQLGAGRYCSGTCRKRHFDSMQPLENRRCRDRQNAWIGYRRYWHDWPKGYNLQRDDCLNCPGTVESGKCPALIKKNKRVFEKYAKPKLKKR
jgi:hypothetical protein